MVRRDDDLVLNAGADERLSDVALRRVPFGLFAIFLAPSLYRVRAFGGADADDGGDAGTDDGGCGAAAARAARGLRLAVLLTPARTRSRSSTRHRRGRGRVRGGRRALLLAHAARRAADGADEPTSASACSPATSARSARGSRSGAASARSRRYPARGGLPGFRALWAVSFCVLGTNRRREQPQPRDARRASASAYDARWYRTQAPGLYYAGEACGRALGGYLADAARAANGSAVEPRAPRALRPTARRRSRVRRADGRGPLAPRCCRSSRTR